MHPLMKCFSIYLELYIFLFTHQIINEKTNQMKRLVSLTLKADIIPLTASEEEKTTILLKII